METKLLKRMALEVYTTLALILAVMPTVVYLWTGELHIDNSLAVMCLLAHVWIAVFVYANCFREIDDSNLKNFSLKFGIIMSIMTSVCPIMWYLSNNRHLDMSIEITVTIALSQVWIILFVYVNCFGSKK